MSQRSVSNIETIRVVATLLLVSFHAIGPDASVALKVEYPHPLRLFADFGIDIRMPIFAFVAGWVYALRPVAGSTFAEFAAGKARRLIIPGLIASTLFWLVARNLLSNSVAAESRIVDVVTLTFAHYWFLQAILLILLSIAAIELLDRKPLGTGALLSLALVLILLPKQEVPFVETGKAQYLAPYFLFGMLMCRNPNWLTTRRGALIVVSLLFCAVALWMNVEHYRLTGALDSERRDLQSALMAFGAILFLIVVLPPVRSIATFGTLSFTIFLYHPFGTSAARRAMWFLGIENVWIVFAGAVVAGILLPIALHLVLARWSLTRTFVLGVRRGSSEQRPRTQFGGAVATSTFDALAKQADTLASPALDPKNAA